MHACIINIILETRVRTHCPSCIIATPNNTHHRPHAHSGMHADSFHRATVDTACSPSCCHPIDNLQHNCSSTPQVMPNASQARERQSCSNHACSAQRRSSLCVHLHTAHPGLPSAGGAPEIDECTACDSIRVSCQDTRAARTVPDGREFGINAIVQLNCLSTVFHPSCCSDTCQMYTEPHGQNDLAPARSSAQLLPAHDTKSHLF